MEPASDCEMLVASAGVAVAGAGVKRAIEEGGWVEVYELIGVVATKEETELLLRKEEVELGEDDSEVDAGNRELKVDDVEEAVIDEVEGAGDVHDVVG